MVLLGAHMSAAGGLYKAVEAASAFQMDTVQIFTNSPSQWSVKSLDKSPFSTSLEAKNQHCWCVERDTKSYWSGKSLSSSDIELFSTAIVKHKIASPVCHASYLINLASPNPELQCKSIAALADEWQRCDRLGLTGLVMHPGTPTDGNELLGLERVVNGILLAQELAQPKVTRLLIENTAGQGKTLGWKLEHLSAIDTQLGTPDYLGFCLDTCHAHAAGYDLTPQDGVQKFVDEIEQNELLNRIVAIHLNDSKKGAGSRVDRHEHIGLGTISLPAFERFLQHDAFQSLPMFLETEKGINDEGEEWDAVNMRVLRQLCR